MISLDLQSRVPGKYEAPPQARFCAAFIPPLGQFPVQILLKFVSFISHVPVLLHSGKTEIPYAGEAQHLLGSRLCT